MESYGPIEELYVFVTIDESGKEKIIVIYDEQRQIWQPMIALSNDMDVLEQQKQTIIEMTGRYGMVVELVKFTQRKTIEVIGNRGSMN